MDKHRVIIGWLFEAMTMLLAVFIAFAWKRVFGPDALPGEAQIIIYAIVVAVIFALAGLTLLLKFRYAHWMCLPFSVVMLVYSIGIEFSPIGIAVGSYYIWYFWKTQHRQAES
jgi:hypothetical protein